MALETATYVDALVTSNPDGADARSTADDHLRLIKAVLKRSFPMVGGAVSASAVALSYTNDLSASVQAQLNTLRDGSATAKVALTATTAISASSAAMLGGVSADKYARLDMGAHFKGAGSQVLIFETDGPDPSDYAIVEVNAGAFNLYGYDNSAAVYQLWLSGNLTTGVLSLFGTGDLTFNGNSLTDPDSLGGVAASNYARLDAAQTFQKGVGSTPVAVAYGTTITLNCANGNFHRITLTGPATLAAPDNPRPGQVLVIAITQGGSGNYNVTWNSVFRFAGSSTPTLSTTVGDRDVFSFIYDDLAGHWLQAGLDVGR